VELMIVVAIIGILAAIAIPKFADMLEKSREGATKGNLSSVNSGIALYVSDNQGSTPVSLDTATFIQASGNTLPAFVNQYMDNIPGVKATGKKKSVSGAPAGWANWSNPSGTMVTRGPLTVGGVNQVVVGGQGWLYNTQTAAGSDFWVNSTAGDMKSQPTIPAAGQIYPYTIYGYE
jgi:type II secretory pathway pseudopilin PulG